MATIKSSNETRAERSFRELPGREHIFKGDSELPEPVPARVGGRASASAPHSRRSRRGRRDPAGGRPAEDGCAEPERRGVASADGRAVPIDPISPCSGITTTRGRVTSARDSRRRDTCTCSRRGWPDVHDSGPRLASSGRRIVGGFPGSALRTSASRRYATPMRDDARRPTRYRKGHRRSSTATSARAAELCADPGASEGESPTGINACSQRPARDADRGERADLRPARHAHAGNVEVDRADPRLTRRR